MFDLQIASIELKMPVQDFETALRDCIDDYHENMDYAIKPMRTRHGKNMYKITIDNTQSSTIEIVGEQDDVSGDIYLHPFKLSNMNESFYKVNYSDSSIAGTDSDPSMFFCHAMNEICRNQKGSFAYIDAKGNTTIIRDGSTKRGSSVALVDSEGNVYSCVGAKSVKGVTDSSDFTVRKPINEWLGENPEVQRAIAKLPLADKMNYIGKYLISAKLNEEIDADEFTDIFCQAGLFGFTEQSVLNIYKLIM